MQVIATEMVREYLLENLPKYENPAIYITTNFIPGCPACNSHATVFYINLTEKNRIDGLEGIEEIQDHKFPIPIFVKLEGAIRPPRTFIIGAKKERGKLKMILQRIIYE